MSGKNWAPGFIQVLQRSGGWIYLQIADIVAVECDLGTAIRIRGTAYRIEVHETPEEIADLIRDNWEKRISGEAAMGAEYGSGDYKIGKDGWK